MNINESIKEKFAALLTTGTRLTYGGEEGMCTSESQCYDCAGWLASASNLVQLVISNPNNPYRTTVANVCKQDRHWAVNKSVGEVAAILRALAEDIDAGLLASIEDHTRASVFDNFLDHAKEYFKQNRKQEAGVIAGVVFEDMIRTICRNACIPEKDRKLDTLIDDLVKAELMTQVKAKRAKVAAHVRTKATHAQWEEYDINDVSTCIDFTEEMILKNLDKDA